MSNPFSNLSDLSLLSQLASNEAFQKLLAHPKMQALFADEEFRQAVLSKNILKWMSCSKLVEALKDPEVAATLGELKNVPPNP